MKNIPLYDVRQIANLKEMLEGSAKAFGSKPAFLVKSKAEEHYKPISYLQFKKDVDALGTMLVKLGLKGKRIALIGENRYEWCVSYLASINGTGTIVPLDKELPSNEIENLISRSKSSAIIFSGNYRKQIEEMNYACQYYIDMDAAEDNKNFLSLSKLLEKGCELIASGDTCFTSSEIDNGAPDILLFTSGTTDISKAVMLSHSNIASNLTAMCSMLYIGQEDIFLSVLPIHHTYECTCGFLCPLYRGATVAFCEGLRHIPKNLKESKATVMLGVPLIFEAIYKRIWDQASKTKGLVKKLKAAIRVSNLLRRVGIDITKKLFRQVHMSLGGNVRIFISGAAAIDPIVAKGFRELGIQFVQGYGLTECSPIAALNRDVDFNDSAAGIPLPNLQIRIDNKGQDGVGEIVVKGPSVMLGYFDDTEQTGSPKGIIDGWFHTGDLGYMDEESFLYITGRKKNVIVTKNGKNIYPEEIETLINRIPLVKESIVYGKNDSDSADLTVAAIVVPDMDKINEAFEGNPLSHEDIYNMIQSDIKAVNKGLVSYKHVKHITLRHEEFAKTTTKKIKRYV
ncbi:long-chain acyl-CoA synthetase [Anaerobacterium chartisolvens]|uniref:Long-chain acyl-CoA synthetase n=1 Tax=Anaerobacterium chartisolvens TaxID=1297424 RepID=A0A369B4X0_9FIRM|nr:AMP-binding protein [Anaerobacterium chartisolvens]RCX16580.1 long-chain acyl-CoA synthetase [Anaerobacterium chartisolvens]